MAGSFRLLIALAVCAAGARALGQEPSVSPPAKKSPGAWLGSGRKAGFAGTPSPEFENVRRALDALTPEQRKRFQENFVRWANLAPEEKKALLDREELRKKVIQQEVEVAIQESGLQLDGERRAQFVRRYGEERRKIEEQLRKETNEKRKPLVHELIGRLKTEFSTPAATPAPSIAPQ
ncbi:MAG TPA: hypothetical protein VEO95_02710 [Chthoniobacteraceae bacterium]|nr:hypothetical protein [Chthoniobacteraceae bacterium]